MNDQYTPTTGQVRFAYIDRKGFIRQTFGSEADDDQAASTEFDRWLNSIKAGAWETGALWAAAECGVIEPDCPPEQWLTPGDNPYREQDTP